MAGLAIEVTRERCRRELAQSCGDTIELESTWRGGSRRWPRAKLLYDLSSVEARRRESMHRCEVWS